MVSPYGAESQRLSAHWDHVESRIAWYEFLCRVAGRAGRAFVFNADQLGVEVIGMLWEVSMERIC